MSHALFSEPLAYPSTLDRLPSFRSPSYVEGLWSPSLGALCEKGQAKATHNLLRSFRAPSAECLSLSGGASIRIYVLFKLSITSGSDLDLRLQNDEGDPVGSPSTGSLCG